MQVTGGHFAMETRVQGIQGRRAPDESIACPTAALQIADTDENGSAEHFLVCKRGEGVATTDENLVVTNKIRETVGKAHH